MPGPPELLILLVVVLVLFGGAKLPKLARSLGEAQNEFKKATNETTAADAAAARRDDAVDAR
ncbi:MAG TPA: twin-arginine translocase TatA/TatE family subunit [Acidimicrobiales bacterium]|jgi:sec-independent protein translocase protein TatA|nr:twin-arginine translocase TatA/TatE family subunit [Acidimicrobiales bacterium]